MSRNKYKKEINGRRYWVSIYEGWIITTISVRNKRYNTSSSTTYVKERRLLFDDVERLSAELLSEAVQIRESDIEESNKYDERVSRALDVVEEEYES